jgi:hypothetical protein
MRTSGDGKVMAGMGVDDTWCIMSMGQAAWYGSEVKETGKEVRLAKEVLS